jgi:tRNA (guanine37-N1)-methyltransferase
MWIGVVSIFPEMFETISRVGVLARAIEDGIVDLRVFNPREFTDDRHATVDDRPYGGGPGMVMKVEPLLRCVEHARQQAPDAGARVRTIYLSPQAATLDQQRVRALADAGIAGHVQLLFICGRYEGIDERLVERAVDEELSIGDYVLTGGELGVMVVIDALSRYLPGTLGNAASVDDESHVAGLLDCPHYTRPETFGGQRVPAELLSGDHARIGRWRLKMALGRTFERRPDMLVRRALSADERTLLQEFLAERDRHDAQTNQE